MTCTFGVEAHRTLVEACRYARRYGHAAITEEAVLLALVQREPSLRREFDSLVNMGQKALSSGTDIGLAIDGRSALPTTVEDDALAAELRDVHWQALGESRSGGALPWSPALLGALNETMRSARSRDERCVGPGDIVNGLFDSETSSIRETLAAWSTEPFRLRARAAVLWSPNQVTRPYLPTVDALRFGGIDRHGERAESKAAAVITRMAWWYSRIPPIVACLESEAVRQAVRLGDTRLTTAHLLLGTLSLNAQLSQASGVDYLTGFGSHSLLSLGVRFEQAIAEMSAGSEESMIAPRSRRHRIQTIPGNPRWSVEAARAGKLTETRARGNPPEVHADLLVASVSTSDAAGSLLRRLGVNPSVLAEPARGLTQHG
jgi:hypothetical protein